jgi:hypothetical protein
MTMIVDQCDNQCPAHPEKRCVGKDGHLGGCGCDYRPCPILTETGAMMIGEDGNPLLRPADTLRRHEFVYSNGRTTLDFAGPVPPLQNPGGYLCHLVIAVTGKTPFDISKLTPKQRRRYVKKQRRADRQAWKNEAPYGPIRTVEWANPEWPGQIKMTPKAVARNRNPIVLDELHAKISGIFKRWQA